MDLLLERGYQVRILDNLQLRVHPQGKPPWVPKEVEFIQGDVANPVDLARALEGIEAVFHLAAYQDYTTDFSRFIHTNAESAALLFELIVSDPSTGLRTPPQALPSTKDHLRLLPGRLWRRSLLVRERGGAGESG